MGLFDRMYYGKAGKADYTAEDLPKNRFQLFFEVLRVRFWSLMRVNLMQVLFFIPLIIWTYMNFAAIQLIDVEGLIESAEGAAAWGQQALAYLQMYLIGLIPCIAITGPSSAAAAYVARNWARDQHSFVWSDFKDAFKDNWKQALVVSTITGLLPTVLYFGYTFYGSMAASYPVLYVAQAVIVMLCVVWLLMLPVLYPLMVGYELKLKYLLKNALLISIGRLPQVLGTRILLLIPMAVLVAGLYIMNGWMILGALVYYVLFGLAFSRLVYASLANGFFDKFINSHIEGAPVGMGLYHDEDDEDDEDEDSDE